MTIGIKIIAN